MRPDGQSGAFTPESDEFWTRPDIVARFAGRDPDLRLMKILEAWTANVPLRVLDLGCAGGRNAEALVRAGADVHALDLSPAMLERTRDRMGAVIGMDAAADRTHLGSLADLTRFADGGFDLVVALGVYGSAGDRPTFGRALAETARVLGAGGRALVATFSPVSRPEGVPLQPVNGERDTFIWRGGRRAVLLEPVELDAAFAAHGLMPTVPTATVRVPMDNGFRVTINALYSKSS